MTPKPQLELDLREQVGPRHKTKAFYQVHADYLLILDKSEETAKVLSALEFLSRPLWNKSNDPKNWWIDINNSKITSYLLDTVHRNTVTKKLALLREKGILEVKTTRSTHHTHYRLNLSVLDSALDEITALGSAVPVGVQCLSECRPLPVEVQSTALGSAGLYIRSKEEKKEADVKPQTSFSVSPGEENLKAKQMSETEIILKRYSDLPKNKKSPKFQKTNLRKLNEIFGEKIDQLINNHGYDTVLQGMENFLQDPYWLEQGLQLHAFLKQADRYLFPEDAKERATANRENRGSHSATSEDRETSPAPGKVANPVVVESIKVTSNQKKALRRNEMLILMNQCDKEQTAVAGAATEDLDTVDPSVIDYWFGEAVAKFTMKFGVQPNVVTKPLKENN